MVSILIYLRLLKFFYRFKAMIKPEARGDNVDRPINEVYTSERKRVDIVYVFKC